MEEETTTDYMMTEADENARNHMKSLMKQPKAMQRFRFYQDHKLPKHYQATVVVDKKDRISIIRRTYELRIGINGCFIKETVTRKSAITYLKTGRSSARLKYWSSYVHKRDRYDLLKELAERVNPDTKHVFDHNIVRELGTQGMHGYILAGNIATLTEAMQYYIRYSMRGAGIDQSQADNLASYISHAGSMQSASMVLRNVVDPNALLDMFKNPSVASTLIMASINSSGDRLARMAMTVGEKIDFLVPNYDAKKEADRLELKIEKFKSYFNIWEDGPVLWQSKEYKAKAELNQVMSAF